MSFFHDIHENDLLLTLVPNYRIEVNICWLIPISVNGGGFTLNWSLIFVIWYLNEHMSPFFIDIFPNQGDACFLCNIGMGLWEWDKKYTAHAHGSGIVLCYSTATVSSKTNDRYKMMPPNGNTFRVTGPLCGEFTSHRWIPRKKASYAEPWCFLWSAPD